MQRLENMCLGRWWTEVGVCRVGEDAEREQGARGCALQTILLSVLVCTAPYEVIQLRGWRLQGGRLSVLPAKSIQKYGGVPHSKSLLTRRSQAQFGLPPLKKGKSLNWGKVSTELMVFKFWCTSEITQVAGPHPQSS